MEIKAVPLKPLNSISLTPEETVVLKWIRSASWGPVADVRDPIPYKARVPQFYNGVQLYRTQASGTSSGTSGMLDIFIRKLSIQGIITKQGLYSVEGHGSQPRYLLLKKADLDNLGVGKKEEDPDEL